MSTSRPDAGVDFSPATLMGLPCDIWDTITDLADEGQGDWNSLLTFSHINHAFRGYAISKFCKVDSINDAIGDDAQAAEYDDDDEYEDKYGDGYEHKLDFQPFFSRLTQKPGLLGLGRRDRLLKYWRRPYPSHHHTKKAFTIGRRVPEFEAD